MPNVQIPPGLSESDDVDHDQTQGGTEGNPHGDSAASGDVSSIQSSGDVDHDNTSGGTAGNPHSGSASTNHGNASHSATFAEDGDAQPPESHGNADHTSTFAVDGNAQPPENHGNAAHNSNFAVDGDTQPPESHGDGAHTVSYSQQNSGSVISTVPENSASVENGVLFNPTLILSVSYSGSGIGSADITVEPGINGSGIGVSKTKTFSFNGSTQRDLTYSDLWAGKPYAPNNIGLDNVTINGDPGLDLEYEITYDYIN